MGMWVCTTHPVYKPGDAVHPHAHVHTHAKAHIYYHTHAHTHTLHIYSTLICFFQMAHLFSNLIYLCSSSINIVKCNRNRKNLEPNFLCAIYITKYVVISLEVFVFGRFLIIYDDLLILWEGRKLRHLRNES